MVSFWNELGEARGQGGEIDKELVSHLIVAAIRDHEGGDEIHDDRFSIEVVGIVSRGAWGRGIGWGRGHGVADCDGGWGRSFEGCGF